MTLHLGRISQFFALQISDRLVNGGVEDPLANKNLNGQERNRRTERLS
jgi:hypothetical protein